MYNWKWACFKRGKCCSINSSSHWFGHWGMSHLTFKREKNGLVPIYFTVTWPSEDAYHFTRSIPNGTIKLDCILWVGAYWVADFFGNISKYDSIPLVLIKFNIIKITDENKSGTNDQSLCLKWWITSRPYLKKWGQGIRPKQDMKIKLKSVFINHDLSSPQFFGSLISNVNVV